MIWYERIIYELGFWLMNTPQKIGLYLSQSMLARSHRRTKKAEEAGPYEF